MCFFLSPVSSVSVFKRLYNTICYSRKRKVGAIESIFVDKWNS